MIVAAHFVGRSRRVRSCVGCFRMIPAGDSYVRLYGGAHPGDTYYAVAECVRCVGSAALDRMKPEDRRATECARDIRYSLDHLTPGGRS